MNKDNHFYDIQITRDCVNIFKIIKLKKKFKKKLKENICREINMLLQYNNYKHN